MNKEQETQLLNFVQDLAQEDAGTMHPYIYIDAARALLRSIDSTPQPDTNQGARYVVEGDFRGMFTIRDLDDYSFRDTEYTDEADAQAACDRLNASTPEAGSGNGGS